MSSKNAASLLALTIAASLATTTPARATPSDADLKMAQSLFDEARTLMKSGAYAQACPKLAESQRLDPALGTLLNLALCHRLEGRLATAWAEFHDAVATARQQARADREEYAQKQLREIEPHLSHLTVTLAPGAAEAGLEVRLDGTIVREASFGTRIEVDPGTHHVDARAPGKRAWSADVAIGADADDRSVVVPALEAPAPPPRANAARRTTGWIVGGAGVAALGVGILGGLQAASSWHRRNDACPNDVCSPAGLDADRNARRWATVTDVALALGIVGVGVGTYLVLTSSARVEVRADAATRAAGVSLVGAW